MGLRIGQGVDFHRFGGAGPCIIGGVEIPHSIGLLGHSDADVLTHALCDALLGALSLGDIGEHFPDTDERYRGIYSQHLLAECYQKVGAAGFTLLNADCTIVCERPKILPYRDAILEMLGATLDVVPSMISLKATTSEKLGALGREEGVAALAIVLLASKSVSKEYLDVG